MALGEQFAHEANFATYEILQVEKISQPCKIFVVLHFMLSLTRILCAWINLTILA